MSKTIEELQKQLGEYFPSLLNRVSEDPDVLSAVQNGIEALESGALSWARLNQILHLCSQAGMSEGFYKYYFLTKPERHPYPVEAVFPTHQYEPPEGIDDIRSLEQFRWGVRRFVYDAMLYWGNFREAYRGLRQSTFDEIEQLFASKRIDEKALIRRGKVVSPEAINRDHRHLISETACKTYEAERDVSQLSHVQLAVEAFRTLRGSGTKVEVAVLRETTRRLAEDKGQLGLFELLFEEGQSPLETEEQVLALYTGQAEAFRKAREAALRNTRTYLSVCSDLDVYVATSMRTREDFREMARTCEVIFADERLKRYNVRYFDPTLSAANYHEDKGIIECLMVKTCKVLLYFAQHKESLGKVSEYAMALSLGKPVIILCPADERGNEIFTFYRDRHPLLRLIQFTTGIVNGAIVTRKLEDVVSLLERIFSNRMEYDLDRKAGTSAYYLLKERSTQSTVRIISDDRLLTETFWNNYHKIY